MKKLKSFIMAILCVLIVLSGCSASGKSEKKGYDNAIVKQSEAKSKQLGFADESKNPFIDGSRFFKVIRNINSDYVLNVNGTQMVICVPDETEKIEYLPTNICEVSEKTEKLVEDSKNLVNRYIDNSEILKDKEGIKKYIAGLNIMEGEFTEDQDVGAYFSYKDNCIYINKNNSDVVCEWMIVHELIHALSFYTHDYSIEKEQYAFNMFNEVLTDMITSCLNPNLSNEIISGYSLYYDLLYPYLNIFKEDAIRAYFYGYEDIYKMTSEEELDFFVSVIDNIGEENSEVYYNNLILKWEAMKVNSLKD